MAVELYDEHEQGERVRQWLQSNGVSLVVAIAIALAGVFGYQRYQVNQLTQQSTAASYFNALQSLIETDQLEMADDYFQELQAIDDRGYYQLSAMLMAKAYVDSGRLGPARELYQSLWSAGDLGAFTGLVGLRLARLMSGSGDHDDALSILESAPPIGYEAAWWEARGDVYLQMGRLDEAQSAYQAALDAPTDLGFGAMLVQMKLDATGPGAWEPES